MFTLQRLAKAGLFIPQGSGRNHYPTLRKQLRLSVPDVDEHNPNDIAYVYSGYAPLSVRLVQYACRVPAHGISGVSGWRGYEDALRLVPGETIDEAQRVEGGISQRRYHSFAGILVVHTVYRMDQAQCTHYRCSFPGRMYFYRSSSYTIPCTE
jgi:hypothetical protein